MSQRCANLLLALAALFFWAAVAVLAITNPRVRRDEYPYLAPSASYNYAMSLAEINAAMPNGIDNAAGGND